MKNTTRMYFFAAIMLIVTMACSTVANLGATPTPVPTNTPVPTSTPIPSPTPSSSILFEDGEFTNSCKTGGTDDVDRLVENGQFKMTIKTPNIVAWTDCTEEEFSDFVYEVDATQLGGPDNNIYGVLFRYDTNIKDFYVFAISGDGYYVIAVDGPNREEPNMLIEWQTSSAINLGNATNHIKIEAVGSRISYYVNDQFLGEIQDSSLSKGVIGVFVGTLDDGNVSIGYDNMRVSSAP